MSAVVFNDDLVAEEVALELRKFKRHLGWTDDHEYKFNKTKKYYVKQVLRLVSGYNFDVYGVVVNSTQTGKADHQDHIAILKKHIIEVRAY